MKNIIIILFASFIVFSLSGMPPKNPHKIKSAFSKENNLKPAFRITAEVAPYICGLIVHLRESSGVTLYEDEQMVHTWFTYTCAAKMGADAIRLWNHIIEQNQDSRYM